MPEEYLKKVVKLAEVKYELDPDILEAYYEEINMCWNYQFTPIRTVEYIAELIF